MHRGSSATHNNMIYITPFNSNSVYQYIVSRDKWQALPPCPYRNAGLVIVDGALTAVGGKEGTFCTSRVFTLRHGSWLSSSKWVERYPPMPTARSDPAVVGFVSDNRHTNVIAVGGWGDGGWSTAVVELFKTGTQRWYTLTSLPKPIMQPSAVICGDSLCVIKRDTSGFLCSLKVLISEVQVHAVKATPAALRRTRSWSSLQSNATAATPSLSPVRTMSPPVTPSWSPFQTNSISMTNSWSPVQTNVTQTLSPLQTDVTAVTSPWCAIPQLPVRNSTVATLCGKLVVVGGQRGSGNSLAHSIYQLLDNKWVDIGSMNTARCMCFAVSPVPHKIVIAGGSSDGTCSLKCTELCSGS